MEAIKQVDFDLSKCIGFVTSTATKTVTKDFNRRMEKCGSTRIQWIALYFLLKADKAMSQKELAALMNIEDPSLARLIDRMERDQLLRRVENPKDKRIKILELTEVGRVKAEDLMPYGQEFSDLLLEDITDEEVEIFQKVLKKMVRNIEKK
jgi:DNA-binding MarR family transcriptional regulator